MVRLKFVISDTEYYMIKISDTTVIIQWFDSIHGKPGWCNDSVKNVLENLNNKTTILLEGDVSTW